jgi:hypothetical protein
VNQHLKQVYAFDENTINEGDIIVINRKGKLEKGFVVNVLPFLIDYMVFIPSHPSHVGRRELRVSDVINGEVILTIIKDDELLDIELQKNTSTTREIKDVRLIK